MSGNLEKYQSAYQPDHSMETALLKVRTDLLASIVLKGLGMSKCGF